MSVDTAPSFITTQNLVYELANGRRLFDGLSCAFHCRQTAIVGPNGIGKSVLANLLAGNIKPSAGSIHTQGLVSFVPQFWLGSPNDPLLRVLGFEHALKAMEAIEGGATEQCYFDCAEPWWDWQLKLEQLCHSLRLSMKPELNRPIGSYSGGEQLRWLWIAALLKNPDIVVLDEPSNHLDREGREKLLAWIQTCKPLLIIASHDRELLAKVNHIVELSVGGCYHHHGNFDVYQHNRQARLQKQQKDLGLAKQALATEKHQAQRALEKQQQRAASGKRNAASKDRSALEIGAAKNQASASQKRQGQIQADRLQCAQQEMTTQAENAEWQDPIAFSLPDLSSAAKNICSVQNYCSPFIPSLHPAINFDLKGSQRLHILGNNGSGKSLLLRCLAQQLQASSGQVQVHVPFSVLDQHCSDLDRSLSGVENFQRLCPGLSEQQYRERLAWLRLRAEKADVAVADLSGGEQLKVAIAVALLGPVCPQLLLLDEPSNHLDLDSLAALEQALAAYTGSLILISHDRAFAGKLHLSQQLRLETGVIYTI